MYHLVDKQLFKTLARNIRNSKTVKRGFAKDQSISAKDEIDCLLHEFRLQVDVLIDMYDRANLYGLLTPDNFKRFYRFDVKCTTINDIIVPFFLERIFGSLNKLSAKVFNKTVLYFITRVVKVNLATWSLLLPELDFVFLGNNWLGRTIESAVFSRLFSKQRSELTFTFSTINQAIEEHVSRIEELMDGFFQDDQPLSMNPFMNHVVLINQIFSEAGSYKFPEESGNTLNLKDICKATNFSLKKEVNDVVNQQIIESVEAYNYTEKDDRVLEDEEYWQRMIEAEEGKAQQSQLIEQDVFEEVSFVSDSESSESPSTPIFDLKTQNLFIMESTSHPKPSTKLESVETPSGNHFSSMNFFLVNEEP